MLWKAKNILSFFNSCLFALVLRSAEDEQQQKSLSSSKSVRQLTAERDQAVADLNSVERSFADLFRRYENMKGVLEGFKKVSRALVDAIKTNFPPPPTRNLCCPPRNCPERGRVEEVCAGLPDADQTGGAAISDTQSARWGETEYVKLYLGCSYLQNSLASLHLNFFFLSLPFKTEPTRRSRRFAPRQPPRLSPSTPAWGRSRWRWNLWKEPSSKRLDCPLNVHGFSRCDLSPSPLSVSPAESRDWGAHQDLRWADCQTGNRINGLPINFSIHVNSVHKAFVSLYSWTHFRSSITDHVWQRSMKIFTRRIFMDAKDRCHDWLVLFCCLCTG